MNAQKFARIAESLRQYRRAELRDFEEELGEHPVDTLYVDPLPDNAVLRSVLSSNSTFLLGRKGTGKSTIFAKAQSDIRKRKDLLSAYIDVKSLYDIVNAADAPTQALDSAEIDLGIYRTHMLRKTFLGSVIAELLKEKTIRCGACGKRHPLEQKESFELFKWRCPDCRDGICVIVNLADDFKIEVERLREDLLLEGVELELLNTLRSEAKPMRAGEISALIDASYQLIGHRTSKLRDLGLIDKRPSAEDGKMRSAITDKAVATYFGSESQI